MELHHKVCTSGSRHTPAQSAVHIVPLLNPHCLAQLRRDPNWHPSACNICGQVCNYLPCLSLCFEIILCAIVSESHGCCSLATKQPTAPTEP